MDHCFVQCFFCTRFHCVQLRLQIIDNICYSHVLDKTNSRAKINDCKHADKYRDKILKMAALLLCVLLALWQQGGHIICIVWNQYVLYSGNKYEIQAAFGEVSPCHETTTTVANIVQIQVLGWMYTFLDSINRLSYKLPRWELVQANMYTMYMKVISINFSTSVISMNWNELVREY